MCGLVARWLTFSGVRPVRAQPTGSPSRTTKMGWRIRLRGLPAASTVVAVQKTVSVVMRRKSSSNSEKECVIGQSS
jgi:hypothetical protein